MSQFAISKIAQAISHSKSRSNFVKKLIPYKDGKNSPDGIENLYSRYIISYLKRLSEALFVYRKKNETERDVVNSWKSY
jgi:hypothetical protein